MNIRQKQEQTELRLLSPYATRSMDTKGRRKPEMECEIRTCFQRDRDRILPLQGFSPFKRQDTGVFITSGRSLPDKTNAYT